MQSTLLSHSQSAQQNQHANKTKFPLCHDCVKGLSLLMAEILRQLPGSLSVYPVIHGVSSIPGGAEFGFMFSQTAERPIVEVYDRSAQ